MTIDELDRRGILHSFSTLARDGVEHINPERHRWYFLDGMLYEAIKPRGQAHWTIYEIGLTRTGREWESR